MMKVNRIFLLVTGVMLLLASCKNSDIVYPDFNYKVVYFANPYPARTVELGEDLFVDNSLDNQHMVSIKATIGGTRDNKKDVKIDFKVDETLCDGLYFAGSGAKVVPMPTAYYQLASNQINIPSGNILGGVEVKLTDAFFADPKSLLNTYVIPLVMTKAQGVDSILQGKPLIANPNRCVDANWSVKPMDFVLYAIKFVNQWHGNYLRRGADQITKADGTTGTSLRHSQYVEDDQVVSVSTSSLKKVTVPLSILNSSGQSVAFNIILTFGDDGTCSVAGDSPDFDISGFGKFVPKGEKKSFGGNDRDVLYLDYQVDFKKLNIKYATKDTMVVRDRAVKPEYFTVNKI